MRRVRDNSVAGTGADEMMHIALDATRATYPHPNPRVGAVLTSPDRAVISVAAHNTAGDDHAEVLVLAAVDDARGTTMYVTLEPCNHHGRTPPCTEAIIKAGVSKVVVGAVDPDSRVSGAGVERLRESGIDVVTGVIADDVVANDPGYFHHRATGLPLVTLKVAATLDGQVGAADGTSKWISSSESREDAHRLRAANDVVIVGVGTVIADDPRLDVRLDGYVGHQPRPVVIAGGRDIPSDRRILKRDPIVYHPNEGRSVDPTHVVDDLGHRGIVSAMIEGGPSIAASFLGAGLVDRLVWYVSAKLAEGRGLPAVSGIFETISDATQLEITNVTRVGPDIRIDATIKKEQ